MEKLIKEEIKKVYKKYSDCVKKWNNKKELLESKIDPTSFNVLRFFRKKTFKEAIELEINRKIDKTILNALGSFYENILNYISNCEKPTNENIKNFNNSIYKGFDLVWKNNNNEIIAEIKNKHNTTNSGSSETIYKRMLNAVNKNKNVVCYLVEIISKESKDEIWKKGAYENAKIRRISIDRFLPKISKEWTFYKIWLIIEKYTKIIGEKELGIEKTDNLIKKIEGTKEQEKFKKLIDHSFKNYLDF